MVVHSRAGLVGAIDPAAVAPVWGTFYDIRRYGGLQTFLRAVLGGGSLVLSEAGEAVGDHLVRLARHGVTHLSGTPSHWRRALMAPEAALVSPRAVRLSGEIADQAVLDALARAYPGAAVGHAYASTEAGVGFEVTDGREGFPAAFLDPARAVAMKVEDGSLRIRSARTATRYLGAGAPALADADGFVDTDDLVERRGERLHFVGRRSGVINVGGLKVHPEEVEAVINRHAGVRMSLVKARANPITGAVVVADVVAEEFGTGDGATARQRRPQGGDHGAVPGDAAGPQGAGAAALRGRARRDAGRQAAAPPCVTSSSPAASRGLGLGIVRDLAASGHRVLAVARRPSDGLTEAAEAAARDGTGEIRFVALDLADIDAIPALVQEQRRLTRAALRPRQQRRHRHRGHARHDAQFADRGADPHQHPVADRAQQICGARHDGGGPRPHRQHGVDHRRDGLQRAVGLRRHQGVAGGLHQVAGARGRARRRHGERRGAGLRRDGADGRPRGPPARPRSPSAAALRRLAEVEDVAKAVGFLMSDAARNITGTVLTVDAGNSA